MIPVGIATYFATLNGCTALTRKYNLCRLTKYSNDLIIDDKNNTNDHHIKLNGFKQYRNGGHIGIGINEGYNGLLSERNSDKKATSHVTYYETKLVKLLELFFDNKEELHNLYQNNNLLGIVKQLENYAPKEDVIKLILDIDKINDYAYKLSPIPTLTYLKTQLRLYEWFITTVKDQSKLQDFKNILYEDQLTRTFLDDKIENNMNISKGGTSKKK
jgi:hypothetical protein